MHKPEKLAGLVNEPAKFFLPAALYTRQVLFISIIRAKLHKTWHIILGI